MKPILLSAVAVALLSAAAHAGTETYTKQMKEPAVQGLGGPYWAVFGGVNLHQTADIDDTGTAFGRFSNELDAELGWFAGLKFGYDFDSDSFAHAAMEVEAFYTHVDAEVNSSTGLFDARTTGDIHSVALMVNGLVKFKPIWHLRPYVGGGVGIAHVWLNDTTSEVRFGGTRIASGTRDDAEDWTLAYQGIAGMDWWVTERWTVFTEYKALVYHDAVGLDNYLNHLLGAGVRFKF